MHADTLGRFRRPRSSTSNDLRARRVIMPLGKRRVLGQPAKPPASEKGKESCRAPTVNIAYV